MSFLICEKCEGHYELKPGEKPEDYNLVCECGGKIQFKKSNNGSEDLEINSDIWMRFIAIILGIIIIVLSVLVFDGFPILIPVIAGFATGFIAGGSYKDAIFNNIIIGGVGGIFAFLIFIFGYFLREGGCFCAYHTTLYAITYIIPSIVLCIVGGIIAIFIRKNTFQP